MSAYTIFSAFVHCLDSSEGKDDADCDFVRYSIVEGSRRGHLFVRWDALKFRLVVKETTVAVDEAVSCLLASPKYANVQGVVLLNVLSPALQAKLVEKGWTIMPESTFPTFVKMNTHVN